MRKTNLIAFATLLASVSAGCEYHHDGFQEVRMPAHEIAEATRETEVATTPAASPDVSPEILKGMTDLQNKIDELERKIEEQNTMIAAGEYVAPAEPASEKPAATDTPGTTVPEQPAEPSADETSPEPTIDLSPTLKVDLVVGDSGDNTFLVIFNEEVDFAAADAHHSIALYTSLGMAVPGYLTADGPYTKVVKFVTHAPLTYKRNSQGDVVDTFYTLKVFGVDPNPSKAVKDKEGKALQQDYSWKLTCVDTPDYMQFSATHCE